VFVSGKIFAGKANICEYDGTLLTLLASIILPRKNVPGTNTIAYFIIV